MILTGKHLGSVGILREVKMEEGVGVIGVDGKEDVVPFNLFSRFDRE